MATIGFAPKRDEAFKATQAPAGTREKLEVLADRVRRGEPLWHDDDRADYSGLTGAIRPRDEQCARSTSRHMPELLKSTPSQSFNATALFSAGTDGTNSNGLPKRRLRIKSPAIFRSAVPATKIFVREGDGTGGEKRNVGVHAAASIARNWSEQKHVVWINAIACIRVGMMVESEHGHSKQWPWHQQNQMSSTTSLMRRRYALRTSSLAASSAAGPSIRIDRPRLHTRGSLGAGPCWRSAQPAKWSCLRG